MAKRKKLRRKDEDKSIWNLIDREVILPVDLDEYHNREVKYYTVIPSFGSSKRISELIDNAKDEFSRKRENEVDNKVKLTGWRKQTGLGSIPQFQALLDIEKELTRKLKIINEAKKNETYSQWHWTLGSPSFLTARLEWVQEVLEEFRYQRDNPRHMRDMGRKRKKKKKKKLGAK